MTSPRHRARTFRRVYTKLPGNSVVIHYKKRKPSRAKCGNCSKALAGVPRERPTLRAKIPKSSRRPERPYGGVLCASCMREKIKLASRN